MDKPWIKAVLIVAFVVALLFVFVGGYQALQQPNYAAFELPTTTPVAPPPLSIQKIENFSKPDEVAKQLEQMNLDPSVRGRRENVRSECRRIREGH